MRKKFALKSAVSVGCFGRTDKHIPSHLFTCLQTQTHMHTEIHICTYTLSHSHTDICTYTLIHTHINPQALTHIVVKPSMNKKGDVGSISSTAGYDSKT